MSEEQPTFKITDRRLFNADGSPRDDVKREPEAAPTEQPDTASPETRPAREATSAPDATRAQKPEATTDAPNTSRATTNQPEESPEGVLDGDPTFINLLMFVASPAAAALGLTEHPGMAGREVDLELAKHCIDLLGSLHEKTRGNLSLEEQQTLDGLLAELRMQYLSLTGGVSAPVTGARRGGASGGGFTGGDITGGR